MKKMNINISNNKNAINHICTKLNHRIKEIKDLKNIPDIKIIIKENFDSLAIDNQIILNNLKNNPSYYSDSEKIIYINQENYNTITDDNIKIAILMHEIAHHFIKSTKYQKFNHSVLKFQPLNEDITVDYLLCKWGFFEEIYSARNRENDYGSQYAENLQNWEDKDEYIKLMSNWNMKKLIN